MKNIIYLIALLFTILMSSCEIDNYDLPDATLKGALTDDSGNPFITEQPNGFQIRIIENGSSQPRDFWGKPDGTFLNTKIFKGSYKVVPKNGAFFPLDTIKTEISGVTTTNFKITPFLTIDASITNVGSTLKATFTIKKALGAGKIQEARLFVNKWNPNVGMNYNDKNVVLGLSGIDDETIVQREQTIQMPAYIESGVTYYARIAVLSANLLGKYNFSKVVKIVVE